jgi:capsular polysaccharide transport system ATP-binding protein
MIKFEDVAKTYHIKRFHNTVLKDVSFDLPFGASIGICGANGAGKSTLMRMIAGVEAPTSGKITRAMTTSWPIGYTSCFQSSLTGADNARFIARIYGREVEPLLDYVEDFAQLGAYFYQPISTYSAGMTARLAFGVSLAIDFECYLVDEVTSAGDDRFRKKCEEALHYRRSTGTLVMISHDPLTLTNYCTSGAVLHGGRLTFYDSIQEAIEVHLYNQAAPIQSAAVKRVAVVGGTAISAPDTPPSDTPSADQGDTVIADAPEEQAESPPPPILSREEVVAAWQCFLGRVPEEQHVLASMALGSQAILVRGLITCEEFLAREQAGEVNLIEALRAYEKTQTQMALSED